MKLGDLVSHEGRTWLVRSYDDRSLRLATLDDLAGRTLEVPHDLDATEDCRVLDHPATSWPYLIVRDNPKGTFITGLARVVRGVRTPLTLLEEWCPNDPARPGGPIYVNPTVGVLPADILLVSWLRGSDTSVQVPVTFGTMAQKVARAERKKPTEVTVYDRLLQDRFEDNDE